MHTRSKMSQCGTRADAIPIESVFILSLQPVEIYYNDPAKLYTYAATSTLSCAGRGLFVTRVVGPDTPIGVREYIGKYRGGEDLRLKILAVDL